MPPKRKPSKKSKKSKRASTKRSKRSTKKSKSKRSSKSKPKPRRKSNFRNKKLKLKKGETLPVYEPMTPQERAQALIRVKKGDYLEGSHPRFIRSEGKTGKIIKNPRYEDSLAGLLEWTPANEDLDVMMDEQGADRPGYEPEPDMKRQTAESAARYNQMIDEKEQKRVAKELKIRDDERRAAIGQERAQIEDVENQYLLQLNQLREASVARLAAIRGLEHPTEVQLRAADDAINADRQVVRDLRAEILQNAILARADDDEIRWTDAMTGLRRVLDEEEAELGEIAMNAHINL